MLTYVIILVCLLIAALAYFYFTLSKLKAENEKNLFALKEKEKNYSDLLRKDESAQKDLKEKIKLLTQKLKKQETKKQPGKNTPADTLQSSKYETLETENSRLQGRLEHLEAQVEALTSQLKEKEDEQKQIKLELKNKENTLDSDLQSKLNELKREQGKLQEKALDQKKKQNKSLLELKMEMKKLEKINDLESKKLKKKLKHYQHFYSMAISQKTMLEDKIENWEKALVILASWILKTEKGDLSMGELVANAIEKTGSGSLVEDEFNFKKFEKPATMTSEVKQEKHEAHEITKN